MDSILYLECASGISGDMTVAALLDLGASKEKLLKALKSIPVQGFETEITRVKIAGIDACDFNIKLDAAYENHDHDMEYLHGHEQPHSHGEACAREEHCLSRGQFHDEEGTHSHGQAHDEESTHSHGQPHDEESTHSHGQHHDEEGIHSHGQPHTKEHTHPHEHRSLPEVLDIIERTQITPRAKEIASRIFHILGEAEAKAHGQALEEVHFHEVGAVDSIADIIAAAVCLDDLNITRAAVPSICEGRGTVRCQHGILPVPVPAVLNIAQKHHLTLELTSVRGEMVTPTGAAIAAAIRTEDKLPAHIQILRTGIGAGKRRYERPSLLRVMMIQEVNV